MSKKRTCALAAALLLALSGCGAQSGPVPLLECAPAPSGPVSAPPEKLSPEELLTRQPTDDTHDAFLVDTGGKLGTLLVTVEMGERDEELWESPLSFAVWDPADMSGPIQRMEKMTFNVFDRHEDLDANFDGFGDFSYTYAMGNQPSYSYLWIWDEDTAQFVEVPEYAGISGPRCDPETEIIDGWARSSGAGDGVTTFHRWEDGELVCIRRIETWWEATDMVIPETEGTVFIYGIKVEDRIDGELTQVYYEELPPGEDFFDERAKWERLDYHGEN